MSLINDALKRASRAQKENPGPPPPELHFRPAEPTERPAYGSRGLIVVCVLVALVLGGFLVIYALQKPGNSPTIVKAAQTETLTAQAKSPEVTATVDAAAGSPPASPAPASLTPSQPSPTANLETPPAAVPDSAAAVLPTNGATVVVATEPPKPPEPKLQGIFYNPSRPAAVISGKTVYVGSRVTGFQVLAINRESVILGNGSVTNVLTLDQ